MNLIKQGEEMVDLAVQENDFYTVEDVQKILRIGKNQTYALFRRNDFPSMKIGTVYRVSKQKFDKWCELQSYNN